MFELGSPVNECLLLRMSLLVARNRPAQASLPQNIKVTDGHRDLVNPTQGQSPFWNYACLLCGAL